HLATSADNSIVPRLRELLAATSDPFFTSRFTNLITTLTKIKPAKLTAAEKRLLAQLREPSAAGEADLLAAIYALPDDDAPRLVYAD
ncbi:TIGR02996 domain-containing protein, partial [Pseudomonas silesiensis]|uniref:TIGR02996 domain-containing protein n=1 Tax=Pseudomonas silesiensis TaxID=1853130 RepID=UPI0034D44BD6